MLRLLNYFKKRSERTTDNISKQEQLRRLQWDIVIVFNKKLIYVSYIFSSVAVKNLWKSCMTIQLCTSIQFLICKIMKEI